MSFICGSFKDKKEDDFEVLWPYPPTPARKTKRHRFCCKRNKENNKNPYSNRGLDKFEALLADIDDKKQKIFTQKGSEYISFVRFVYSNSNDVKPVIVWLKDPRKQDKDHHHKQSNVKDTNSSILLRASTFDHYQNSEHVKPPIDRCTKMIGVDQWKLNLKRKLEEWWMPSYNLPLFMILVLVFLTFFGRSLAIICTSIAWYLIPSIDGTPAINPNKKGDSRKPSENIQNSMISSPEAFFSGPMNVQQRHKMKKLMSF